MRELVTSALQAVIAGEKTVQEAMDGVKVDMDKLVKQVRDKWPDAVPVIE